MRVSTSCRRGERADLKTRHYIGNGRPDGSFPIAEGQDASRKGLETKTRSRPCVLAWYLQLGWGNYPRAFLVILGICTERGEGRVPKG